MEKYLANSVVLLLIFYQKSFSPDHGIFSALSGRYKCRFYPTCSAYAILAVRQYGLLKGGVVSLKRIVRCNPWHDGGYDPVTTFDI